MRILLFVIVSALSGCNSADLFDDAGCGLDCRDTPCPAPTDSCPAGGHLVCDIVTGDWLCESHPDAGGPLSSGACALGEDWTCNDNLLIRANAGVCMTGGICQCNDGFALNHGSGRCRVSTADAGGN